MRIFALLRWILLSMLSVLARGDSPLNWMWQALFPKKWFGQNGVCVIGCTPYVEFTDTGLAKYRKLVEDMVNDCDIIVHIGDTKPAQMPCNTTLMTKSVHILREAAAARQKMVLYTAGDNEINDCHRLSSQGVASDFYKASDARQYMIDDLQLSLATDLTGGYVVENHTMEGVVPGTDRPYSCEFDKYASTDLFAVSTLEVIGSHYYLADERATYPQQDAMDPLEDRLGLFLNANACTLDWIEKSAEKASSEGKRALLFMLHAKFHRQNGRIFLGNNGIGPYYDSSRLGTMTETLTGDRITHPYQPLFDKLTQVALSHPNLLIFVVHGDGHSYQTFRMNGGLDNRPNNHFTNHNLMIHQIEGASRALTMYTKFTVDSEHFQPVSVKQQWSKAAYEESPVGHAWEPY